MKILTELLQSNITSASFEIDEDGIFLRVMDQRRTILIDLVLNSDSFSVYKFRAKERLLLGICLTHLHKMLKTVKKRDSVEFLIDDKEPTDLMIKIIPKENNRTTTSSIKIQNTQNIAIDLPDTYGKPVIVPSSEFQKMCKGLAHISPSTRVTSRGFSIRFSSDNGGVMKRYTEFGEIDDADSDGDYKEDEKDEYSEEFDTDQLTRITKLSGLNNTMQIFPKKDCPLLFRSTVGTLGKISIYLKSKNLQENESRAVEEED